LPPIPVYLSNNEREATLPDQDLVQRAKDMYAAFAAGDRDAVEQLLSADFSFSSPLDVGLDRAGYFERCWPGAGRGQAFTFQRLIQSGDEVIVTYELTSADGRAGVNTEVLTFGGDQLRRAEVYFGWDLPAG
jgi:ketosteroid isomerase-like protein